MKNFAMAVMLGSASLQSNAAAQTPSVAAPNALRLYVVNGADRPVALAEVKMSSGQRTTIGRTDSAGLFRADGLEPGDWRASVRRIGYNEAQIELHVLQGENAFTVTVDRLVPILTDVNVEDKRISLRIADFEARRARGEPSAVVTREQIRKRDPIGLSQMLRAMPGVQVVDDFGVKTAMASRGSVPARGGETVASCPMRIAVDGMMRPVGTSLDEVVPSEVHGIEVYYGPARLPLQLATFRADKWCGLVAIWTRDK